MAYDRQLRQHQNMARGNGTMSDANCGCESLASVQGGSTGKGASSTPLSDSGRSGPPHVSRGSGKMGATAHSDHGPHY